MMMMMIMMVIGVMWKGLLRQSLASPGGKDTPALVAFDDGSSADLSCARVFKLAVYSLSVRSSWGALCGSHFPSWRSEFLFAQHESAYAHIVLTLSKFRADRPKLRIPKSFDQLKDLNALLKKYKSIYPFRTVLCFVSLYLL